MKHLLLDINIVLDLWLKRGEYKLVEELIENCDKFKVKLWFSTSSLWIIEYILIRELKKRKGHRKIAQSYVFKVA